MTFLVQYQLHADQPGPFHLFNIILHSFNSVLALWLLLSLLSRFQHSQPEERRIARTSGFMPSQRLLAAGFGALLFAVHPLQTQAVVYIYQRSTLLATLFCFLAILLYIRKFFRLSFLFIVLAVLSKEFAAVLPVILWLYDGLRQARWKPRLPVLIAGGLGAGAGFLWSIPTIGVNLGTILQSSLIYAATQIRVLWYYVGLSFFPIRLNVDWDVQPQKTLDLTWWLALVSLGALLWLLIRARNRWPLVSFLGLLYFCFLLPTSSLLPRPDFLFEHRVYAALLGFSGLLSFVLAQLLAGQKPLRGKVALSVALLVPVIWANIGFARLWDWQSEVTLWRDAVEKSPGKYRTNLNYGMALVEINPEEAIIFLSRAVAINPQAPFAYRGLGEAHLRVDRLNDAADAWVHAHQLDPGHFETLLAMGEVKARQDDFFGAREYLKRAQEVNPRDWRPYFQLAQLNVRFGFTKEASIQSELGLSLNPDHTGLRLLLADAMMTNENWSRAVELYTDLIERNPRRSLFYFRLARAFAAAGERDRALSTVRRGLETVQTDVEREAGLHLEQELSKSPE